MNSFIKSKFFKARRIKKTDGGKEHYDYVVATIEPNFNPHLTFIKPKLLLHGNT
jgi:hypothetical protein